MPIHTKRLPSECMALSLSLALLRYITVIVINTLLTSIECHSVCGVCDRKKSGSRSFQQVVNVVGVVDISVAFDILSMYTTIGLKAELYFNLNPCVIGWF